MNTNRNLENLKNKKFDILIIGAGISGAFIARDAALRGLSVAIIEKKDFGHATSMATSKLIHGGLRYLAQYDFALVRESLRERRFMEQNAAHLVDPLPFLLPIYDWTPTGKFLLSMGLRLYDFLSFDKNHLVDKDKHLPNHKWLNKEKTLEQEPGLDPKGLKGSFVYYDALNKYPERMNIDVIKSACEEGAIAANYVELTDFRYENPQDHKNVIGATVKDLLTDESFNIDAKVVVNSTGPWGDLVLSKIHKNPIKKIIRSKGIHLVLKKIHKETSITFETKNKKHFFIIPWNKHSLIGTTDSEFKKQPDELSVTENDINEFLDVINECYNGKLTINDVVHSYAGIRPLVADSDTATTYEASRKHEVINHKKEEGISGIFSVFGGKYTSSRQLAETTVDEIVKENSFNVKKVKTEDIKLVGSHTGDSLRAFKESAIEKWATKFSTEMLQRLLDVYGSEYEKIISIWEKDKTTLALVHEFLQVSYAEIDFAILKEQAQTLEDIFIRRIGIGNIGFKDSNKIDEVSHYIENKFQWKKENLIKQKAEYLKMLSYEEDS